MCVHAAVINNWPCVFKFSQSSNEVPACVNCNSGISISVEDTDESGANIHLDRYA